MSPHHPCRNALAALFCSCAAGVAFAQSDLPDAVPLPPQRAEETRAEPAPDKAAAIPETERQCRLALDAMDVVYREAEPQDEPSGCRMDHPLIVEQLPGGVAVEPEITLNCRTAQATAHLVQDVIAPAAEEFFDAEVASLQQMSGYVCRARTGGGPLSEHAFGNAIDIGSVTLGDGTSIVVRPYGRAHLRRDTFQWRVREGACGIFTTVLGPATDEAHADHLHLDLAERRPGSTWCR